MKEDELLDPSLLDGLTKEQKQEALAAAAAAKRAEERAEQRALERAMQRKAEERRKEQEQMRQLTRQDNGASRNQNSINPKIVFVSKRKRQNPVDEKSQEPTGETNLPKTTAVSAQRESLLRQGNNVTSSSSWTDKERQAIRQTYLGSSSINLQQKPPEKTDKRKKKKSMLRTKKATFRFEWDNEDDTLDDHDPLYSRSVIVSRGGGGHGNKRKKLARMDDSMQTNQSLYTKPLSKMTSRDWRIYRENYEIVVKGGRAPAPLRNFREASLHPALLDAIENVMQYKDPTPIQRQSIPIGLQRRDLIGIAETGSGKTCAFGVPLLEYILKLPNDILERVADQGPLALVMAPTRELAFQIHGEFLKMLSRQSKIVTAVVVGGQSIQHQAQQIREGVHVIVGTPGRINDCIEMAYLVLNQCCYIVLDEADRMIDMGFAPQMESILDAMGGTLKSENEQEAYEQEAKDLVMTGLPRHRLMGMFTATMPLEVERMAKRYLRHPAIVSIGDQDSVKNARIVQKIIYLSSSAKKESALRDLVMDPRYLREKVIVFVNEKKHADGVGRMVERMGRACVVLHGGKSQDQRNENLQAFRQGGVVLVATDVAGRGLDIPNVAHVINFDLPSRSIDSYSHRIGRTGRAGKEGLATSLMTDEDEGIMAPLKAYLESTGNPVPNKLANHPAANSSSLGNLIY